MKILLAIIDKDDNDDVSSTVDYTEFNGGNQSGSDVEMEDVETADVQVDKEEGATNFEMDKTEENTTLERDEGEKGEVESVNFEMETVEETCGEMEKVENSNIDLENVDKIEIGSECLEKTDTEMIVTLGQNSYDILQNNVRETVEKTDTDMENIGLYTEVEKTENDAVCGNSQNTQLEDAIAQNVQVRVKCLHNFVDMYMEDKKHFQLYHF